MHSISRPRRQAEPSNGATVVAVVTSLSPSPTTLAEYGLHLLAALGAKEGVRVVALVEEGRDDYPAIAGVEIRQVWRFGSLDNPLRVARAVRAVGADAAIVNAHFTSFGSSKVAAAFGLMVPAAIRAAGVPVVTLMHNIMETVDLNAAGFRVSRLSEVLVRAAGSVLTWMVLRSNIVATTMPRYVDVLRGKYRAGNVVHIPHGTFGTPAPPAPAHENDRPVVMAFGKFGTYKKVEDLIAAVRLLNRPEVTLVIAGTDSPNTPGYLARIERELGGPDVRFVGYVPEDGVELLFRTSTVTVFPYSATTGSSGVLHQAGGFGCPPVLPRVGDLEDLVISEGYTGAFFRPGDVADLARAIGSLLDDPVERDRVATVNYEAASGLTMSSIADLYLEQVRALVGAGK
jgi:glycosyltransferase involved in cell wall biosynthesis